MSDLPYHILKTRLTVGRLIRALVRDGFQLDSGHGSHRQYRHADGRRVTVTFHHQSDIFSPKTLKSMVEIQARWIAADLVRLRLIKDRPLA